MLSKRILRYISAGETVLWVKPKNFAKDWTAYGLPFVLGGLMLAGLIYLGESQHDVWNTIRSGKIDYAPEYRPFTNGLGYGLSGILTVYGLVFVPILISRTACVLTDRHLFFVSDLSQRVIQIELENIKKLELLHSSSGQKSARFIFQSTRDYSILRFPGLNVDLSRDSEFEKVANKLSIKIDHQFLEDEPSSSLDNICPSLSIPNMLESLYFNIQSTYKAILIWISYLAVIYLFSGGIYIAGFFSIVATAGLIVFCYNKRLFP